MHSSKRRPLLVISLYVLLSVAATWPLAQQLGSVIPGDSFDGWQNVWNLWWMRESWLVRHASPYYAPVLHFPTGADLRFQTMAPFNGLITLPIQLVFGLLPAYNAAVLFSFVIGGFGAYLLALYALRGWGRQGDKEIGNHPGGTRKQGGEGDRSPFTSPRNEVSWILHGSAFIAGLIYAFSPYHFAHLLGHLQLIALQWIPFYILCLLRGLDRSTLHSPPSTLHSPPSFLRDGLKAGLFLILVGLCDWYYVMYCLLFTGLAVLIWLIRRQLTWRGVGVVVTAGVLFGVVLAPLLLPMIQATRTWANASLVRDPGETLTFSADLLGFVTPQVFHPLWGDWALDRSAAFSATPSEYTVFAGFTVLFLAGIALMATRKQRRNAKTRQQPAAAAASASTSAWFWMLAAGVFAVLALGPVLKINGRSDLLPGGGQIPLPYALLYRIIPFIKLSRSVSRFDVLVMLCLGVAAAFGVAALTRWAARRSIAARSAPSTLHPSPSTLALAIPLLASALILFEFLPTPYPISPPDTPAWYKQLAADPSNEAVLNLPANYERPWYLLYQITHGKPLATGYVTRDDPSVLRERAPVLSQFWFLGPDIHTENFDLSKQGMQVLHDLLGVGWVVLDRYKMPGGPERDVTTEYAQQIFAGQTPIYEDDRLTVYRVTEPAERGPYIVLAPGWQPRQTNEEGAVWRDLPAGGAASFEVVNPSPGELVVEVVAAAPAGGQLRLLADDGAELAVWEVGTQPQRLQSLPLALPAGISSLRLQLDSAGQDAGQILEITVHSA